MMLIKYLFGLIFAFLSASCSNAGAGSSPALINGKVVDPKDYPASVWIGNCTGTIVGKNTLLTAGHCVGSGGVSFTYGPHRVKGECRISKEYAAGDKTADWAMCFLDTELSGFPFETINFDNAHVKVGDEVLLSGFGCQVWGGPLDGKYRVGKSTVIRVPSAGNNDIVTRNGAALCSGDSGGPAWSLHPDGTRNKLLSANSRSDTRITSYLSSTATPEAKRYFGAWQALYPKAEICGFTKGATGCRGITPPPPDDNEFEIDHDVALVKAKMKPGYEEFLKEVRDGFIWIMDYVK